MYRCEERVQFKAVTPLTRGGTKNAPSREDGVEREDDMRKSSEAIEVQTGLGGERDVAGVLVCAKEMEDPRKEREISSSALMPWIGRCWKRLVTRHESSL
ncbi:unnamed protein product, partial [Iphiclides podalirius]